MWAPKTTPREYQTKAVRWLAQRDGGLLFFDTRTGKTKVAIDYLSWLTHMRGVNHALVVCPKIAINVWLQELDTHWWGAQGWRDIVEVINYDKASVNDVSKLLNKAEYDHNAMVLDECHLIKTPSSKRSRKLLNLSKKARYKVGLTATPVTKRSKVAEIYPQAVFVYPELRETFRTAQSFREHFAYWSDYTYLGPRHEDEYAQLISEISLSISREEALNIDGVAISSVNCDMPDNVRRVYQAISGRDLDLIGEAGWTPADTTLGRYMLAQRVLSGVYEDGRLWSGYLLGHVLEQLEGVPRAIVCCHHLATCDVVAGEIARRSYSRVYQLDGRSRSKHEIVRQWSQSYSAVLVVQPSSVAMGVDMRAGSKVIWYSPPVSFIEFKQMSDRIALNPDRRPEAVCLKIPGTINEDIYSYIESGQNVQDNVIMRKAGF